MKVNISLDELVTRGAHFGHMSRRWNPKMAEYIHGVQDGTHIFDLVKTKECLETALNFLAESQAGGKVILLVGTKKQAKDKVKEVANELSLPYITERWLGGVLTNFTQIKSSTDKLKKMREERAAGEYKKFTKKERLLIDREIERLDRFFGGLTSLTKIPDILFIVDAKREFTAVSEAGKMDVATVAILDTNADPTKVDYPIPMNDDAAKALDYVLDLLKETLQNVKGQKPKETEDKKVNTEDNS